ncbi:hypothetical protein [uncultured Anaerococcus sp.]|uniref:hypothetical protein n=1 Tax=uncultured Anaerococcus sp. TaxID=293428 RepID=UPI002635479B|nr:hypothetical protein [uncultured Anaerococcus sp.]
MKKLKINFASFLGLVLLILSFFAPTLAPSTKLNTPLAFRLINAYLIAYLAYTISFMDTRKVVTLFIPLITFTIINLVLVNGRQFPLDRTLVKEVYLNIRNFYDLISLVGIFFIIELGLNKLFGNTFTSIFGAICLVIFFYYDYSKILYSFTSLKDIFLYFAIYIMALRVRQATRISPLLYGLALILIGGEIYLIHKFKLTYGFLLTSLGLIYLILKGIKRPNEMNFEKFMIFVYTYIFPTICLSLRAFTSAGDLISLILANLITFFVGQALYLFRIRLLNYILIGIN